jgi:archaellum biogenesis ATPase FlaH
MKKHIEEVFKLEKREIHLLKAVVSLLSQQERSSYIIDMLSALVVYDGAECDGSCLLDDIRDFLEDYKE